MLTLHIINNAVFQTCCYGSLIAMTPLMSRNHDDRMVLTRARDFFELFAELLVAVFAFRLVLLFGGSHSDPAG